MQDLFGTSPSGAEFSKDRKYRYALWRIWNSELPLVLWICLNPSVATETENDKTVNRIQGFTYDWGFGGFYIMNLFAIISKKPSILKTHPNPIGDNDGWLESIAPKCEKILFAWGASKQAKERSQQVIKMFPNAQALQINNDGSPKHPLYVKRNTIPIPFNKK